jgi:hypothetical protein
MKLESEDSSPITVRNTQPLGGTKGIFFLAGVVILLNEKAIKITALMIRNKPISDTFQVFIALLVCCYCQDASVRMIP